MKTEAHFTCEKCGLTDTDVNKVMACERKHHSPDEVESSFYSQGQSYPKEILVTFHDGAQYTYVIDRERRGPDK